MLCCSLQECALSDLDWQRLMEQSAAAGTVGDLMQLAMNCSKLRLPSRAMKRVRADDLDADVARSVWLTAAVRQHLHALCTLSHSELRELMNAATLEKVLLLVWQQAGCSTSMVERNNCAYVLWTRIWPAPAWLNDEQVARLMAQLQQAA
jgi:hypothetical protein